MKTSLKTWQVMAQALVDLFYPLLEATLISLPTGKVITSINSFEQSDPSPKSDLKALPDYTSPSLTSLRGGRKVKTTEITIRDDAGKPKGVLRLRFDITLFQTIQGQIATLLGPEETAPLDNWQTQTDLVIKNYLKQHKLTMPSASRSQKREMVLELHQKSLFDYKDAANYIADLLDTSRATVYNYLNWATTVRRVKIHQVDAFTHKRFGGNPAGVVLDAEGLTDELMRKITREMNLSETAFVLPSAQADLRLRYFTPSGDEVRFCGHSTVGALYMLAHEGRRGISEPGSYHLAIETQCGVLKTSIAVGTDDTITVSYEAPHIDLSVADLPNIGESLGIHNIDDTLPMALEHTNRTLFIPIKSLEALGQIAIDQRKAIEFSKQYDLVTICLLTPECHDSNNHLHCRVFAPVVGIPEDPFTGSVQGGLAAYAHQQGLVRSKTIRVEQGHFIKRPGAVQIHLSQKKGQFHAVIEAQAVHFFSTEVDLL